MDAAKVVPDRGHPVAWSVSSATYACFRAPVEDRAAQVGEVIFVANLDIDQHWTFKLLCHGTEVYRVDARPVGKHPNPANRPDGFPKNVPEHVHEHLYFEAHPKMQCARPLDCEPVDHAIVMNAFCEQAHIDFQMEYRPPPNVELRMGYMP
jgi:hypothetical protein